MIEIKKWGSVIQRCDNCDGKGFVNWDGDEVCMSCDCKGYKEYCTSCKEEIHSGHHTCSKEGE